ncbi:MAG: hypothetical protein IPI35_30310 [Deltaproteobacteria bacterium]|nr:hypothetical protein [Deltaproteobacteria bacterium]
MRFNLSQNDWAQKISFDEEWTPHFLETDDVNGGFFVSPPPTRPTPSCGGSERGRRQRRALLPLPL